MLNLTGTFSTAVLRGAYLAFGSGLLSFVLVWASTDEIKAPVIAGAVAALSALGFRVGVEGLVDRARDKAGTVLPSDPGQTKQTAATQTIENVAKV